MKIKASRNSLTSFFLFGGSYTDEDGKVTGTDVSVRPGLGAAATATTAAAAALVFATAPYLAPALGL